MKRSLIRNALALSFLAFGTVSWLAGCKDNSVGPETVAPSQPTNVTAILVDSTTVDLTSTDNVCVAGYNVYRGLVLIGTTPVNSFRDTGLVSGSTYVYSVEAFDCFTNFSSRSTPLDTVTTPGPWPSDSAILRSAAAFGILAGTTITNTGGTVITGDVGLSPGSSITGFPPGTIIPATGNPHINDAAANQAKLNLTTAYLDLAGRAPGASVAGNIGGQTLAPGTYTSSSTLAISSGDLTLNAGDSADAIFVFQIASSLTVTVGRQVILAGGAQAKNVYWQVGSDATIGVSAVFKGNILALSAITLATGATLDGRAFARNGAITLDNNIVTTP
jgi:hypothetical protein